MTLAARAVPVANAAGRRNGRSAPAVTAIVAMFSESVETTTLSMLLAHAASTVYAISGRPASGRMFLPGTPTEPARAGMRPRIPDIESHRRLRHHEPAGR